MKVVDWYHCLLFMDLGEGIYLMWWQNWVVWCIMLLLLR